MRSISGDRISLGVQGGPHLRHCHEPWEVASVGIDGADPLRELLIRHREVVDPVVAHERDGRAGGVAAMHPSPDGGGLLAPGRLREGRRGQVDLQRSYVAREGAAPQNQTCTPPSPGSRCCNADRSPRVTRGVSADDEQNVSGLCPETPVLSIARGSTSTVVTGRLGQDGVRGGRISRHVVRVQPGLRCQAMSETRKLRFGVLSSDGSRSRVWSVSTVAGRGDVYLTPRDAPANFHFSLHSDAYWHMKMVRANGDPRVKPEEEIPFEADTIPKPRPDGLTRAFVVAMLPGGLSPSDQPADTRVIWRAPALSPGMSSVFSLFFEQPGSTRSNPFPEATMLRRIPRGDGGSVFVTHHEEILDTVHLAVPEEMREARGADIASGRAAAMLVLLNDDGSWRIVEGPVEPHGADAFNIAPGKAWSPPVEPESGGHPAPP